MRTAKDQRQGGGVDHKVLCYVTLHYYCLYIGDATGVTLDVWKRVSTDCNKETSGVIEGTVDTDTEPFFSDSSCVLLNGPDFYAAITPTYNMPKITSTCSSSEIKECDDFCIDGTASQSISKANHAVESSNA